MHQRSAFGVLPTLPTVDHDALSPLNPTRLATLTLRAYPLDWSVACLRGVEDCHSAARYALWGSFVFASVCDSLGLSIPPETLPPAELYAPYIFIFAHRLGEPLDARVYALIKPPDSGLASVAQASLVAPGSRCVPCSDYLGEGAAMATKGYIQMDSS
ncbi:hypothetical protein FA13DRAFT_946308 [Coprinellus micaceus]|uniref:Uncharacterized protein n=1 Tax=Coprinellus micaceus TaxID=71717 RepID=A0A4Y7SZG9_COPMI|nr:hypothetical protein FA13DRAFT_946308 [Coprinellus micaceus]